MLADVLLKVAGMEKEDRHAYYPRPSIAGPERCIRQMTYWANGTAEDRAMADRFVMVLDDSSWHEHLTIDWIQKTAFQIHSQQMKISCTVRGRTIQGSIDGVVTDLLGVDRLFEHKAINHFTWNKYAKGDAPKDYIAQCCVYIKGLQEVNPLISEAVLLMKNKNTAQYLEYIIAYDSVSDAATIKNISMSFGEAAQSGEVFERILDSAFERFEIVEDHIMAKTLPDRPYEFGTDFPCGYCSWQDTCWSGYVAEVAALSENEADMTEMADYARFYNELGAQKSEIEAQRDDVGKSIKAKLKELNSRHGRAGEYVIDWKLQKSVVMMSKEECDPSLLPKVTKERITEPLFIKKFKPKKI